MGRKPRGGYTARIKYVPVPDAAERYARALEILLRAKKRLEQQRPDETSKGEKEADTPARPIQPLIQRTASWRT